MLPRAHRLRRSAEFTLVVRSGGRAVTPSLVLHGLTRPDEEPTRVGITVSRALGDAVARNRIRRQLRHLMRARLDQLPRHASLVVRPIPTPSTVDGATLAEHLDQALAALRFRPGQSRWPA